MDDLAVVFEKDEMIYQPSFDCHLWILWLAPLIYLGFLKKIFKTVKKVAKVAVKIVPTIVGAAIGVPIPPNIFSSEKSETPAAPVITTTNNTGQIFSNIQGGIAISAPIVATGGGSAMVSSNATPIPKTPIGEQPTGFPQIYKDYVSSEGYRGYGGVVSPAPPSPVIYILIGGIFLIFIIPIILSKGR